MKKLIILLIISVQLYAQQIDDLIKKIDIKLRNDKTYLDLNYLSLDIKNDFPAELWELKRELNRPPLLFEESKSNQYNIVFVKKGQGLDSLELLYIQLIRTNLGTEETIFSAAAGIESQDTSIVYDYRDFYFLKEKDKSTYDKIHRIVKNYVYQNYDSEIPGLLSINPNTQINTSFGVTADDNLDYLNHVRINDPYWYPEPPKRRTLVRQVEDTFPFRLDVNFSSLRFSHEAMDFENGNASIFATTGDEILNILPYQGQTVTAGARLLLALNASPDINKVQFIDLSLGIRFNVDSRWHFDNLPFILAEVPYLNVGKGIAASFSITRPFGLPNINLKVASGEKDYSDAIIKRSVNGVLSSYHSFNQIEGTMSFFWNSSDLRTNRFRIDVGAGYYDIYKAEYTGNKISSEKSFDIKFQPLAAIYYDFVPTFGPLFGAKMKVFDSVLNANVWLKLFQFSEKNSVRLEVNYISQPFTRKKYEWEKGSGLMFQLRYRLGL